MRPDSLRAYAGSMQVESAVLGDFEVAVPAAASLSELVDVLWVTPKATQLEDALRLAPAELVHEGRVVTLMNGVDHLQILQRAYRNVIGGAIRVESERVAPGHIRQTSPFIRVDLADGEDIVEALGRAGMECTLGGDAVSILWQKLAFLAPFGLATTAYDGTLGEVRGREEFRGCQSEVVAIARAEGATIDDLSLTALTSGAPAGLRSSMQKDRFKGLPLEVDAIAGPIIRGGDRHGIPTPATLGLARAIDTSW
jgi:2-dehydropantoate 2-reductase